MKHVMVTNGTGLRWCERCRKNEIRIKGGETCRRPRTDLPETREEPEA